MLDLHGVLPGRSTDWRVRPVPRGQHVSIRGRAGIGGTRLSEPSSLEDGCPGDGCTADSAPGYATDPGDGCTAGSGPGRTTDCDPACTAGPNRHNRDSGPGGARQPDPAPGTRIAERGRTADLGRADRMAQDAQGKD